MKLIIDIPDNDYKNIKEYYEKNDTVEATYSYIYHGTPPKTGHWIKSRDSYGNNHFTCPFCEHDIATKYAGIWKDNYCSNCGARMESEE